MKSDNRKLDIPPVLRDMRIDADPGEDQPPVSNHVVRCTCHEGTCECARRPVMLHLNDEDIEQLDGDKVLRFF